MNEAALTAAKIAGGCAGCC